MKLSEFIHNKIKENGWTYLETAKYYQVSPTTITRTVGRRFDIPTDTLLGKYAAKEGKSVKEFAEMLTYLPVVEENMNASSRVMRIIAKTDRRRFNKKDAAAFLDRFKEYCKGIYDNYDDENAVYVGEEFTIPEDESLIGLLLDEVYLHGPGSYTEPKTYVSYYKSKRGFDPDDLVAKLKRGTSLLWGLTWLEHTSIGKVALTTDQLIDAELMKALRFPYYQRYYIIFNDEAEYLYALKKYTNSITLHSLDIYFAYFAGHGQWEESLVLGKTE